MLDRHEPDKQFTDNLEWQIAGEVRRRNRSVSPSRPVWRVARAVALVTVSIAFGAVAMGASQQIEESWRKDLLLSSLEVRHNLAQRRVDMAIEEFQRIERQFAAGMIGEETMAMARLQLVDAEAQAQILELELEEIRDSGREPLGEVSSPLVGGRDFVSERIRVQMAVAARQLEVAAGELQRMQQLRENGLVDRVGLTGVEAAVRQYEGQLQAHEGRLAIRQSFLAGEIPAVEAELRMLEFEAQERSNTVRQQMELADLEREYMQQQVAAGNVDQLVLRQVEFRLAELEAEVRLAELEMEILRRELEARRQQR